MSTLPAVSPTPSQQKLNLHALRIDYSAATLDEASAASDPFTQFTKWFAEAREVALTQPDFEPNAMVVSTVDPKTLSPSSRVVLLKEMVLPTEENPTGGFTFFTNYNSLKSQQIQANPNCSLLFYWNQRQIRIDGEASKLSAEESDAYFASRPRGSQVGAWSSPQSTELPGGREQLEQIVAGNAEKFAEADSVPRPEFWGGYVVVPKKVEFWQGRKSRLHDRIVYEKVEGEGGKKVEWRRFRLAP